jgi:DDE superfamily endonuclease
LLLYRCHITQEFAGVLFRVDKGSICRALQRIEKIAINALGIEKSIKVSRQEAQSLIIDCTEQPIERPKYDHKPWQSGKKKRHTVKTEVIIEGKGRIVAISGANRGSVHDLMAAEKEYNAGISRYRFKVEHAIGRIKVFRMMSDRYRYPHDGH